MDIRTSQAAYRRKVLNQELSLREFAEKKTILKSRPSKAIVELTENCNFRCVMCAQSFEPKYKKYSPKLNMPLELFDKVAAALFDDTYFVDLRGFGESVILPHWPEIVDRLERYPMTNWHLVTNLSLPRDQVWERMMRAGFMLGVSLDAATPKTFEEIRVRSHFSTILRNLELVTDCARRFDLGHVYFIVTVQKRNVDELEQIIELAARFDVREVQFKIVRQFDGALKHDEMVQESQKAALRASLDRCLDLALERGLRLTLNDAELLEGVDRVKVRKALAPSVLERLQLPFPPRPDFDPEFESQHPWAPSAARVLESIRVSENKTCFKPYHFTYVGTDGRVGTCNHMMNPDILEMGNLAHQSFEEIWNGYDYQLFRHSLVSAAPNDPRCAWCFEHRLDD